MAQEIDFSALHKAAYQTMLACLEQRFEPEVAAGLKSMGDRGTAHVEASLMGVAALLMVHKTSGGHVPLEKASNLAKHVLEDAIRTVTPPPSGIAAAFSSALGGLREVISVDRPFEAYISAFEDGLDKALLQRVQGITETQFTEHEKSSLKWLRSHQKDPDVVEPSKFRCDINVSNLTPVQAEELFLALRDAGVADMRKLFDWQHPGQPHWQLPEHGYQPIIIADKQEVDKALKRGIPGR